MAWAAACHPEAAELLYRSPALIAAGLRTAKDQRLTHL